MNQIALSLVDFLTTADRPGPRHFMSRYTSLAVISAFVLVAASIGSIYRPGTWYQSLAKPSWTPPNWLFGPAWTVLYIMIAIAGWRIWLAVGLGPALVVWAFNIIVNALWSYIMFEKHQIGWALADLVLIWVTIVLFIVLAWPIDRVAALLFVPYLLWVSFAGALNATILRLNP